MKLAVISHKICWQQPDCYATDGGFPLQMRAISELFDETRIAVPCKLSKEDKGVSPLDGNNIQIRPLSIPRSTGWRRKIDFPFWLLQNGKIIWREVKNADAVHTPIPGDVGTIGMLCALILKKPLFVRHCGNWFVQRTVAEQFWKWSMERFAGGRNVMLATGGAENPPSISNENIKWIFSTSLRANEIAGAQPISLPENRAIKLVIACRQEERKGTDVVIGSLPQILKKFPAATLDVIGDGSLINVFRAQAKKLNVHDKVRFHGKVEQSRVVELMKQAHVFCYPTSASEGFPKVVLEALACGLPIITTRVSVLPQLIGNSEAGVLLEKPASADLTEAVIEICSNVEKFAQMSERAVQTARQYSLENWRDFIGETLRREWQVSSLSSAA